MLSSNVQGRTLGFFSGFKFEASDDPGEKRAGLWKFDFKKSDFFLKNSILPSTFPNNYFPIKLVIYYFSKYKYP